ncbi:MAG: hypothetical protein J6V25_01645 [Oscillospiraceae bacterium]|nr:hypothetical protein [Oscillospiraceae bacterium]
MTYVTKRCGKCGYSHRVAIYGHMDDPIGIRIAKCPSCNHVSKESKTKEWVQMSPYKKYRSINPRGRFRVFCLGIFLCVPVLMMLASLFPVFQTDVGGIHPILLLIAYPLTCGVLNYLFTSLALTSKVFEKRYCNSILRSRNPHYMEFLKQEGRIYGEEIPSWLLCSKKRRQELEHYIRVRSAESNFQIPSFTSTIRNDL